jgi:hypothetical protein
MEFQQIPSSVAEQEKDDLVSFFALETKIK